MRTALQLRGLIANDRRRIEELSAIMADLDVADLTPAWLAKCMDAHARLEAHERELTLPAATVPPHEALAGSVVTSGTSQPAYLASPGVMPGETAF